MYKYIDFSLVKIRLKQITYESGGLGVFYTIFIIVMVLGLEYFLYVAFQSFENSVWILGLSWFSLFSLHLSRKDTKFIFIHLSNPQIKIFSEYIIFSSLLFLPCLLSIQFWVFIIHILFCLLLSRWKIFPNNRKIYLPQLGNYISPKDFEWLSGFRRNWLAITIVYILTLGFCWLRFFPIISLWFFLLIISGFYNEFEPLNIFNRFYKKKPFRFLLQKTKRASVLFSFFFLPPLIVNAIIHLDIWYLPFIFFIMSWFILQYFIYYKYGSYHPENRFRNNTILQTVVLMSVLIPFLVPLPLFLVIKEYLKALKNLSSFN